MSEAMMVLDPNGAFPEAKGYDLEEACGFLLPWIVEGFRAGEGLKESLLSRYPYYMGPMEGGSIDERGRYVYPGDPKLEPIVRVESDLEKLFIYSYGIVGVIDKVAGEEWVTRMD